MSNAMFGFLTDAYYKVSDNRFIVIPQNADYKTAATSSVVKSNLNEAEIDLYRYHTDLVSQCNTERVAYMKDMLLTEKITNIKTINDDDYLVSVDYDLFNKDNALIKNGTISTKARYSTAYITAGVSETNTLEYRKSLVFDGRIEIQIPQISRYGIVANVTQHPYTLRIKNVKVLGTVGDSDLIKESGVQSEYMYNHAAHHANYRVKHPEHACMNNYASHFVTNAHVGTTIIDQCVASAELEVEKEYELVTMSTDVCGTESVIKLNNKLDLIVLNVEVLLDNFNEVYNESDIKNILLLNAQPSNSDSGNSSTGGGSSTGGETPTPTPGNDSEQTGGEGTGGTTGGNTSGEGSGNSSSGSGNDTNQSGGETPTPTPGNDSEQTGGEGENPSGGESGGDTNPPSESGEGTGEGEPSNPGTEGGESESENQNPTPTPGNDSEQTGGEGENPSGGESGGETPDPVPGTDTEQPGGEENTENPTPTPQE